ncbi:AraC family transcriptional regulator [Paenibacillus sp. TRM 82003]|nr:AraC family transcriptional regulator [Paenibacillus sp. TRM 82003]
MLHEVQHGPPGFPLGVYVNRVSANAPPEQRFIYTHYHHHLELLWVREGAFRYDVEGETIEARAGDLILVGSGRIHGGSSLEGVACDTVSVVFDVRMLYGEQGLDRSSEQFLAPLLSGDVALPTRLAGGSELGAHVLEPVSRLVALHGAAEPGSELMIKALLLQCFFELARAGAFVRVRPDDPRRADRQTERLKEVLLFIDAHLAEKLNVERLAARIHVSPAHFHAFFRKYTGQSPVEYINGLRLARAQGLLSSGALNVQEAAQRVGFENASYFIRCFKKRYGVTPAALKRVEERTTT